MLAFVLGSLREMAVPLAILVGLMVIPMLHPRTRRVSFAVTHYAKRKAPRWLVPVLVACAFIPGPVDEILVIGIVLYPVFKSSRNRRVFARTVSYAWG